MSSWAPTEYKTTNWSAYNEALKRRGSLTIWFDPEMIWRPPPSGKRGRQSSFSNAAIQSCLTMKVLFGMPLRQTAGFVPSLLKLVGLDWQVPDYSTLCRRQRTLSVNIPYRGGNGPLNLLIDSTGSASVSSEFGDGSIDTSGFGLGVTATWYDHRRFYVDGQVALASYSSDLEADRIGTLTDGNGGTGLAFSIEAGQQLDLGARLTVIPQAQLSFSSVEFDDFEGERYGEQVTLEDAASQQLRLGLEFAAQEQGAHRLYGIVNLFHEFGAGSEVDVAGATLTTESEPWAIGVGLGGTYALTDRVDLFGEASYATGLSTAGETSALSANAGLKVVF